MIIDSKLIRWRQTPQYIGTPVLRPNVTIGDTINHNGKVGKVVSIWASGAITLEAPDKMMTIFP